MKHFLIFIAVFYSLFSYSQPIEKEKFDIRVNLGLYSHRFIKEANYNKLPVFDFPLFGPPAIQGSGIFNVEILRGINKKL